MINWKYDPPPGGGWGLLDGAVERGGFSLSLWSLICFLRRSAGLGSLGEP